MFLFISESLVEFFHKRRMRLNPFVTFRHIVREIGYNRRKEKEERLREKERETDRNRIMES